MIGRADSLRALRRLSSWTPETVVAYQDRRVRAVVQHAAAHVPYYRRLFAEAGVDPDTVRTVADLARVPTSTRRAMQACSPRDLVSDGIDPERILNYLSSGSTGEPFTTRRTRFEDRILLAFRLRVFQALGARPLRDRWMGVAWLGWDRNAASGVRRLPPRRGRTVSCMIPPEQRLAEMRGHRCDVLGGLTGSVAEVADVMTDEDRAAFRPRLAIVGGESSTPELRARLAERVGAPVYDLYGTNEFNATAWQCPETGLYHVSDPAVVLEVLDERGEPVPPGGEGEVFGTNLHVTSMPFIRYRLDDVAVRGPSPCPCGAPWSTLERILGRVAERFRLRDGTAVHPYLLQHAMIPNTPWLAGFQIIQEEIERVTLRLLPLPGESPTADQLAAAAAGVQQALGDPAVVTAELVETLPRGGRGKSLHYVCMVDRRARETGSAR